VFLERVFPAFNTNSFLESFLITSNTRFSLILVILAISFTVNGAKFLSASNTFSFLEIIKDKSF